MGWVGVAASYEPSKKGCACGVFIYAAAQEVSIIRRLSLGTTQPNKTGDEERANPRGVLSGAVAQARRQRTP
ncbi:hypothetical protein NDU88_009690 [Pleurodeles waltl]|uniref:Uncharacterized protein n=1 Tax=Pleurodeles waltl TaxID=8319 RepID=A0AAV7QVT5_PLEWA|nr:hypothetical protein NDU88_009690 [Pleurodeles waltl]